MNDIGGTSLKADRLTRADELVARGWVECVELNSRTYRVRSQADGRHFYTVRLSKTFECDCADYFYRGLMCKHILAAYMYAKTERVRMSRAQRN
jgi:hypothetical protein